MVLHVRPTVALVALVCLTCTLGSDLSYEGLAETALGSIGGPLEIRQINPNSQGSLVVKKAKTTLKESAPSRSSRALSHESPIIPSLRQGASPPAAPAHGMISTLTSMVGDFVPYLRRPETAAKPVQAPPTKKVEGEKAVHLDHEHASEPAESLPDGIVSGGFYYEGKKANGEYFNEEMQESESLEIHSHDQVSSPGKIYDDKSDHPYYVVDRPAEGPAPPPLMYFTSGHRSNEDSSAAAWDNYYAKLREYNDYYNAFYRRAGRSTDEKRGKHDARGSLDGANQIFAEVIASTKSD